MLAKKITYTDFNGEECTETFYFNLTRTEITEMQLTHPGGYSEYLTRIVEAKDQKAIIEAFKVILFHAYGEKSEDGKRFKKSKEISESFEQSPAYDVLFTEILTNTNAASDFINAIMPQIDLTEEQQKQLNERTRQLIESKKPE